jgi:hypothetical protein
MSDSVERPTRLTFAMVLNIILGVLCVLVGIESYSKWDLASFVFIGAGIPMIVGAIGLLRGRRGAQGWALVGFGIMGAANGLLGLVFALALAVGFGDPEPAIYGVTAFMLTLAAVEGFSVYVVRSAATRQFLWQKTEAGIEPDPWEAVEGPDAEDEEASEAVVEDHVMLDFFNDPRLDPDAEQPGKQVAKTSHESDG